MRKKAYMVSLFLGFCFLLPGAAAFADQTGEEAAILASEAWLALVDEGKYSESWDEAAKWTIQQLAS